MSFDLAKADSQPGEEPYRRPEDDDIEGTEQRYKLLYSDNFAKIISIYQHNARAVVLTVDASKPIYEVSQDIESYIHLFFKGEEVVSDHV
jgi:adenylate kinase family enzyme